MKVHLEHFESIPYLHITKDGQENDPLPTVFFLHGFQSAKEHNLHYAYNLAMRGMRVILPEARLHGERDEQYTTFQMGMEFWPTVLQSIQEVGTLYEHLNERGLLIEGKIGVGGTSMGAITTYGCLSMYDWISAAVSMMGSAHYEKLARGQIRYFEKKGMELPLSKETIDQLLENLTTYDLSNDLTRLNGRPLFIWHGEEDEIVPFELTYVLVDQLQSLYEQTPERLLFIADEERGHSVPRKAMIRSTEWFAEHLVN
ncbi:prolyl oligopeptidase family serine peptidase [Planococcaceae bacterium Storch 2/2-2]|nr:prolyl oligopeptidase family serine peptidase [Planococcaceae bacterium Storch 2/2-2]